MYIQKGKVYTNGGECLYILKKKEVYTSYKHWGNTVSLGHSVFWVGRGREKLLSRRSQVRSLIQKVQTIAYSGCFGRKDDISVQLKKPVILVGRRC